MWKAKDIAFVSSYLLFNCVRSVFARLFSFFLPDLPYVNNSTVPLQCCCCESAVVLIATGWEKAQGCISCVFRFRIVRVVVFLN